MGCYAKWGFEIAAVDGVSPEEVQCGQALALI